MHSEHQGSSSAAAASAVVSVLAIIGLIFGVAAVGESQVAAKGHPTFERDIRPILVRSCVPCHTRSFLDNPSVSGGLALDDMALLQAGVKSSRGHRSVLTPGKPDESELLLRLITKDTKVRMPKASDPLPAPQIALVRKWISAGAPRGAAVKPSTGAAGSDKSAAVTGPGPIEISLQSGLATPADLLPASAPKDSKLRYVVKSGPLPPVPTLAYSPDGRTLAIGSYRSVFLFDLAEARVSRVLSDPAGAVQSVVWSRDGKRLAVAGGTPGSLGEVIVYETTAYVPITGFAGHTDVIYSVSFSPDGASMVTASQDKTIRTWDIASRKAGLVIKSHSDVVYRARFSLTGTAIFSCGQDRSVRQFEASSGKQVKSFEGHQNAVTAMDIRKDGLVIVTSGAEPRLRWWNVADGGTPRYSDGSSVQVNDIAFSPSGKLLAAAAADRGIRVWNGENGGLMKAFTDAPDWNYGVSVSPDDRFVAGSGSDGAVRIWEIQPGTLRATIFVSPGLDKKAAEWAVFGEHGYVSASPGWDNKLSLKAGDVPLGARTAEVLALLKNSEMIRKALRGEKVDPPVFKPANKAP